jgi:hypothetical protein
MGAFGKSANASFSHASTNPKLFIPSFRMQIRLFICGAAGTYIFSVDMLGERSVPANLIQNRRRSAGKSGGLNQKKNARRVECAHAGAKSEKWRAPLAAPLLGRAWQGHSHFGKGDAHILAARKCTSAAEQASR